MFLVVWELSNCCLSVEILILVLMRIRISPGKYISVAELNE